MRAAALLVFALSASGPAFAETTDAAVTRVEGGVTIVRGTQTFPAEAGTRLSEGDVVKTAPGATADFTMNAVAGCRVMPETECAIADPKKGSMRVRLAGGKILFNLEKLPAESSFRVETPTAIAAVRGTQFSAESGGNGSSFAVRDDAIEVSGLSPDGTPTGETIVVEAGFALDANSSGLEGIRPASGLELTSIEQVGTVKTCA